MALVQITINKAFTARFELTQAESDFLASHPTAGATKVEAWQTADGQIYEVWHCEAGTYMVPQKVKDALTTLGWI